MNYNLSKDNLTVKDARYSVSFLLGILIFILEGGFGVFIVYLSILRMNSAAYFEYDFIISLLAFFLGIYLLYSGMKILTLKKEIEFDKTKKSYRLVRNYRIINKTFIDEGKLGDLDCLELRLGPSILVTPVYPIFTTPVSLLIYLKKKSRGYINIILSEKGFTKKDIREISEDLIRLTDFLQIGFRLRMHNNHKKRIILNFPQLMQNRWNLER